MPANTPSEKDRKFYKQKMKAIKAALQEGNEQEANRHAQELMNHFNIR